MTQDTTCFHSRAVATSPQSLNVHAWTWFDMMQWYFTIVVKRHHQSPRNLLRNPGLRSEEEWAVCLATLMMAAANSAILLSCTSCHFRRRAAKQGHLGAVFSQGLQQQLKNWIASHREPNPHFLLIRTRCLRNSCCRACGECAWMVQLLRQSTAMIFECLPRLLCHQRECRCLINGII